MESFHRTIIPSPENEASVLAFMVHSHCKKTRLRPIKIVCIELYEGAHTVRRPYQ